MRILLVEPDALLGKTYAAELKQNGHDVMHYRHGQTAVLAAEKTTPDMIVLELQLPSHSGVEFLYEFRSYPEWQDIPVVLHTWVAAQNLEPKQLKRLNVVRYLYKPTTSLKQLGRVANDLAE